ncbi:hypothetical protein R50076_20510 [Gilvimarinus japonicus]
MASATVLFYQADSFLLGNTLLRAGKAGSEKHRNDRAEQYQSHRYRVNPAQYQHTD